MTTPEFEALVKQYERLVYTICYQYVKDHQIAEDLMQDTFVSVFLHRHSCPQDAAKPWIARIATNKAKDHLKSAYHRRVSSVDDASLPQDAETLYMKAENPQEAVQSQAACQEISAQIGQLKEPYNQVATLYFLQQRSIGEISQRLQRPANTVQTQLYRARHQLQRQLQPAAC